MLWEETLQAAGCSAWVLGCSKSFGSRVGIPDLQAEPRCALLTLRVLGEAKMGR